ncbi:hypothetical protein SAMN04488128_103724 [Chitinophaga eiseniae]|uniref:Uncharacterized protein n=1 Tax=Chitinophaga eiseniae TaxID=634771 RepID=A0A1T4SY30_9BACT|nr:hypothetical protein [Chitinophaga eiseniae]SKA32818.1 hypothetical protein SAMN04488128_103724 [Chitinophaga eiseniae]
MAKDKRYKTLKTLLEGGNITGFDHLLEVVPLSRIGLDLGANYSTLKKKFLAPETFTISDLYSIADLIETDPEPLIGLSKGAYLKKRKRRK